MLREFEQFVEFEELENINPERPFQGKRAQNNLKGIKFRNSLSCITHNSVKDFIFLLLFTMKTQLAQKNWELNQTEHNPINTE